jgi:hypothetical protein
MRLCRHCGVYAPPETRICDGCGADLATAVDRALPGPVRAAAVRIEHTCRSCGRKTPVNQLPPDLAVTCRCGEREPIAEPEWSQVLGRIHAVADLVGEDPEGFESSDVAIDGVNRFAARARVAAGVVFAPDEADALAGWLPDRWRVWAAPGRPVGPDGLADVRRLGDGRVEVRSDGGPEGLFAVDSRWTARHSALIGAIAEDLRADRAEIVVEDGRWSCPSCGGPLTPRARTRTRCRQCRSVLVIPAEHRPPPAADEPEAAPETWWLLFDGPSAYRRYLEREPSTWDQPFPDEQPLGEMPRAPATAGRRALELAYVAIVPLVLLAIAGWIWRSS